MEKSIDSLKDKLKNDKLLKSFYKYIHINGLRREALRLIDKKSVIKAQMAAVKPEAEASYEDVVENDAA